MSLIKIKKILLKIRRIFFFHIISYYEPNIIYLTITLSSVSIANPAPVAVPSKYSVHGEPDAGVA